MSKRLWFLVICYEFWLFEISFLLHHHGTCIVPDLLDNPNNRLAILLQNFSNFHNFSQYMTNLKSIYVKYVNEVQSSISSDPNKFWAFVQAKKGKFRIPAQMKFTNKEIATPSEIINAFSIFFNNVYISSDSSYFDTTSIQNPNIHNLRTDDITEEEIFDPLKRSKDSLIAGLDDGPSFLLTDCACISVTHLHRIFSLIITTSSVLIIWKNAIVTTVLKTGDPSLIENCICILCHFLKF